jgi:hypothetical protein
MEAQQQLRDLRMFPEKNGRKKAPEDALRTADNAQAPPWNRTLTMKLYSTDVRHGARGGKESLISMTIKAIKNGRNVFLETQRLLFLGCSF